MLVSLIPQTDADYSRSLQLRSFLYFTIFITTSHSRDTLNNGLYILHAYVVQRHILVTGPLLAYSLCTIFTFSFSTYFSRSIIVRRCVLTASNKRILYCIVLAGAVLGRNIGGRGLASPLPFLPLPSLPTSYSLPIPSRFSLLPLRSRPPLIQLGGRGSAVSSPSAVRGGVLAEIEFCAFWP